MSILIKLALSFGILAFFGAVMDILLDSKYVRVFLAAACAGAVFSVLAIIWMQP